MGKKIELFHREIEVKVLLEVLAVYVILAFVLTGLYYLEPAVTGFAIVTEQINTVSILKNENYTLDLSEYFSNADDEDLTYDYYKIDDIIIRFEGNFAYIIPNEGFTGNRFTYITANNSEGHIVSHRFEIEVKDPEKLSIDLSSFAVEEGKWTVEFKTMGTGNLEISPFNEATYAELYNDDPYTINDFDVLVLKCGDFEIFDKDNLIETESAWFILEDDSKVKLSDVVWSSKPIKSVYIENYNCDDELSRFTVRLLTEGEKIQEFKFGNEMEVLGLDYVKKG